MASFADTYIMEYRYVRSTITCDFFLRSIVLLDKWRIMPATMRLVTEHTAMAMVVPFETLCPWELPPPGAGVFANFFVEDCVIERLVNLDRVSSDEVVDLINVSELITT